MTEELKPCPFCWQTPEMEDSSKYGITIWCSEPSCSAVVEVRGFKLLSQAIAVWNRRAPIATPAEVEALRVEIDRLRAESDARKVEIECLKTELDAMVADNARVRAERAEWENAAQSFASEIQRIARAAGMIADENTAGEDVAYTVAVIRARVAELEAAVRPFAAMSARFQGAERSASLGVHVAGIPNMGHCHDARAALEGKP